MATYKIVDLEINIAKEAQQVRNDFLSMENTRDALAVVSKRELETIIKEKDPEEKFVIMNALVDGVIGQKTIFPYDPLSDTFEVTRYYIIKDESDFVYITEVPTGRSRVWETDFSD